MNRCLSIALAAAAVCAATAAQAEQEYEWRDGKWVPLVAPAEGTPAGELAIIRQFARAGQHKEAIEATDKFLESYPDDEGCAEATVLAAQAEMDRGRYYGAFERFEKHLQRYPNSAFLERVLQKEFEIAEAFLAGRKRVVARVVRLPAQDEGLEILLRIAEHAPRSAIAEKALLRIADYHYAKKEYAEAAAAYDRYLDQFGKSKSAFQAMLKAAQAAFEAFKGAEFDETPLLEAEQRYKLLAEQYPAEAAEAKVGETLKEISELRARKIFHTGWFYERAGKATAAVFYYRQVAVKYPQTTSAKDARAGLIRLGRANDEAAQVETGQETAGAEASASTLSQSAAATEKKESRTEQ